MGLNKANKTSFKRRGFFKTYQLLDPKNDFDLFFIKPCRLEVVRIVKLKRLLKKFFKKNKVFKNKKATIFLSKNCPISKKSKNSRMGKGKGKYLRTLLRFNPNHKLLSIKSLPKNRAVHFLKFLSKRKFNLSYLCDFRRKLKLN